MNPRAFTVLATGRAARDADIETLAADALAAGGRFGGAMAMPSALLDPATSPTIEATLVTRLLESLPPSPAPRLPWAPPCIGAVPILPMLGVPATAPGVLDPVQGLTGDCYVIAALSALAWAVPRWLADHPVEAPMAVAAWRDGRWWPVFARAPRPVGWPAAWEASYAAWRLGGGVVDVRLIRGGLTPMTHHAMAELTGGEGLRTETLDPHWFDERGVARLPIVAASSSDMDALRDGMVPNHAYTVLGAIGQAGSDMLVVRNPWGCGSPGRTMGVWHGMKMGVGGVGTVRRSVFVGFEAVRLPIR